MHHTIRTLVFVATTGLLAGHASAQVAACPGGTTRITGSALQALISNNTMCAASSSNADTWQEFHQGSGGGALIDWKQGPSHPVDPTTTVGSWTAGNDANAVLTHSYGASSYSWLVCRQGVTSVFVLRSTSGAADITGVAVKAGQGSCASLPAATSIFDSRPATKRAPVSTPATRAP